MAIKSNKNSDGKMKLYKYKNYAEYIKCQTLANKRKAKNQWACKGNIAFICHFVAVELQKKPKLGLCHGVRQGLEIEWFNKFLPFCKTIGTEIGEIRGKNVIKWDFNREYSEWIGKFDFIYSNSFDHAFQPELTFNVWSKQLKPNGLIILEYDRRQEHTGEISKGINKTDPVSIRFNELYQLIPQWNPMARIIKILDMPVVTQQWRKAMVIQI